MVGAQRATSPRACCAPRAHPLRAVLREASPMAAGREQGMSSASLARPSDSVLAPQRFARGLSSGFGLRVSSGHLPRLGSMSSVSVDESRRAHRGPNCLEDAHRRVHCVSVRLNATELAKLDGQRLPVHMQRGEYLRSAALHRLPPTMPAVSQAALLELGRAASSLNQIARQLNRASQEVDLSPDVSAIRESIDAFRRALIGLAPAS